THIAVRDGLILAVGDADCADGWGDVRRDDRYADAVILPGLVEAHAHVMAGGIWRHTYCGHYARTDPEGALWEGVGTYEAVVARLRAIAETTPEGEPVIGWGFDPNFLEGRRLDRGHLDAVSTAHPVVLVHSNFHLLTANGAALSRAGLDPSTNIPGVVRDEAGALTGECQEFAAMGPVLKTVGLDFAELSDAAAVEAYGRVARSVGVTTVADLLSKLEEDEVSMLERVTGTPAFPARYVPVMNAMEGEPEAEAARAIALRARSTSKLHLGRAKLFTDGAIQGFTAMLRPPGYFRCPEHPLLNMEEDHFRAAVRTLHAAGVKTHVHTNGDAAVDLALSAFEDAVRAAPAADHRHTLEHCQLSRIDQFKRMKALGLTANLFSNHVYYFGDLHYGLTLGPDRARRMNAAADAQAVWAGEFAIHSDAPVTPMAPLFTAWAAVNRVTATGRQLGTAQRLSVIEALRCITLGAAYVLKMDDRIGSLETGKWADMCIVDRDPLSVEPSALRDIKVLGTVLGGVPT
ncbi:MAG: amidohydrolase, partial [Pseudomonadota bacterium]